jgi:hypothetical protein
LAEGGSPSYTFALSGKAEQSSSTFKSLSAGIYSIVLSIQPTGHKTRDSKIKNAKNLRTFVSLIITFKK